MDRNQWTLEQKVGQLIWAGDEGQTGRSYPGHEDSVTPLMKEGKIGGIYFAASNVTQTVELFNRWQSTSHIPLLFAADFECGVGHAVWEDATRHPQLMALGAADSEELAYQAGRVNGTEIRALGLHWTYGQVVDVNTNPDNPIIGVRSFGSDAKRVAQLAVAYIRGVQEAGAIATVKHFPGHGDTSNDSHAMLPTVAHPRERLDAVELLPYREAIAAGVQSIMTSHIVFPALEPDKKLPATLSRAILTDLLRGELGFDGFVITDDMGMQAIADNFGGDEAYVMAINAGADGVLTCNAGATYRALLGAVREGRITQARLDEAIGRLVRLKRRMGVFENTQVLLDNALRVVGCAAHREVALEIARRAATLVRDGGGAIPRGPASRKTVAVMVHNVSRDHKQWFGPNELLDKRWRSVLQERRPGLTWLALSGDANAEELATLRTALAGADEVIIALDLLVQGCLPHSGTIPPIHLEWIAALPETVRRAAVVCFAAPYAVRHLPANLGFLCMYGFDAPSIQAAVEVLFGERPAPGRLPVHL